MKSKDLGQKKNLRKNALDIYSNGHSLVEACLRFNCPYCLNSLNYAYLIGRVLFCKQCKKTFELVMKNSKISYDKLKKDGWIKEDSDL